MNRAAMIAVSVSLLIGVAIVVGGLIPRGSNPSSLRLDGPYLHAAAFGLLVLPLACAWPRQWLMIVLIATVFGGVIEGLQTVFDRAPEWPDIVANTVGAAGGSLVGFALSIISRRR